MRKIYLLLIFLITVVLIITLKNIYQPITLNVLDKNNWILKVTNGYLLNTKITRNEINKVKVCIIDNGFDYSDTNISLINLKSKSNEKIYGYHGTMMALLIGAKQNRIDNFSGFIPGIDLYAYHIEKNRLNTVSLSKAIKEAADNSMDVINLSLSTTLNDDILYRSIKYALNKGIVIVCSSGNTANEQRLYPASYSIQGIISVGAIDENLNVSPFTTFNDSVDVFAPGANIYLPKYLINSKSINYSGTSLAAPIVTSLVILLKAKYPDLTPKDIEKILIDTSSTYTTNWKYYQKRIKVISFKKALSN